MKIENINLNNKRIAIVGNSVSTIDYSNDIDAFDTVIRLNGGALPDNISIGNVGIKTDLIVFNRCQVNGVGIVDQSLKQIEETMKIYNYMETSQLPVLFSFRKLDKTETNYIYGFPPEVWEGNKNININTIGLIPRIVYGFIFSKYGYKMPTSGLLTIIYLLMFYKPKEVVLYNFNFTGTHFFDKSYNDRFTDKAIINPEKDTLIHKANLEVQIISDLMNHFKNLRYAE